MPKHLYLFRHAEAVDKQLHESDKNRELTATGMKDAVQMGAYLGRENIELDVIITSSAARTMSTAQIASDAMRFDAKKIMVDEELYNASVRTFFESVANLDDQYSKVMFVGHNPAISYLAEYLTQAEIGEMATAGIVHIKFNVTTWKGIKEGGGELVNYTFPGML